ncbi:hypothetical protein FLT15_10480 [Paenibacillus thiaminolyticus]|uniref:hypothetical protein n=1 Tax=Paenibacillus thiaminolyticus TaxID=49283 RepID=UPI0013F674B1|nr:hypothetical protein [Paenibacillus thiaminolyticus]NGP58781.1 hypothetical protein [Paenibacillus thiaminolyticus]
MKKLFKIGLLSVGLMTVLGTSIHAAPTPTSTVPPTIYLHDGCKSTGHKHCNDGAI